MQQNNMKQYLIFQLILIGTILSAQKGETSKDISTFYQHKNEIGVNVTSVLGNVLSLNPNNIGTPYSLIYRRHFGKISLRLGGNYKQDNNSTFEFTNGTQKNIELSEKAIDARLGFEYHYPISPRFMFSLGIDGTYNRSSDVSNVKEFIFTNTGSESNEFESAETTNGYGGGPFIRFDFKFNDRISLSTESTMYYNYSKSTDNLIRNNTVITSNRDSDQKIQLVLPQALFVNIAF